MRATAAIAAMLVASAAAAAAPPASPRPDPRPPVTAVASADVAAAVSATLSPRPTSRPKAPQQRAAATIVRKPAGGATICGVRGLTATPAEPIAARIRGCGLRDGVRVTAVQGVALSRPATIDCPTARALNDWVAQGVKPAIGRTGGGVTELRVAASYACRTRNNQPGARVSEHGRGRAIDIAAFKLRDGSEIAVLTGWRHRQQGRILKRIHRAACGPFGTVLGPNSDRYHRDHFHLDTARYRSGPYCR